MTTVTSSRKTSKRQVSDPWKPFKGQHRGWILARLRWEKGKLLKIPLDFGTLLAHDYKDKKNWRTYAEVKRKLKGLSKGLYVAGLALRSCPDWIFLDADDCIDAQGEEKRWYSQAKADFSPEGEETTVSGKGRRLWRQWPGMPTARRVIERFEGSEKLEAYCGEGYVTVSERDAVAHIAGMDLAEWLVAAFEKGGAQRVNGQDYDPPGERDIEEVRRQVALIPNENRSRERCVEIGHAIHGATGGSDEGREVFAEWLAKWPDAKSDADDKAERWWQTFKRPRAGMPTLIREAGVDVTRATVEEDFDDSVDPGLRKELEKLAHREGLLESELDKKLKELAKEHGVSVRSLRKDVSRLKPDPVDALPFDLVEPAKDPMPLHEVYDALYRHSEMQVSMSPDERAILVLWVMATYGVRPGCTVKEFRRKDVYGPKEFPFLFLTSALPGSGKTEGLSFISEFAARAIKAGTLTSSAFFRVVEAMQPTLCVDEVDAWLKSRESEFRGLLNSAHERTGTQTISVPVGKAQNDYRAKTFRTHTAIALAGLGRLDTTVAHRSIILRLDRDPGFRKKVVLSPDVCPSLMAYSDLFAKKMKNPKIEIEDLGGRTRDNWLPLVVVAGLVDESRCGPDDFRLGGLVEQVHKTAARLEDIGEKDEDGSEVLLRHLWHFYIWWKGRKTEDRGRLPREFLSTEDFRIWLGEPGLRDDDSGWTEKERGYEVASAKKIVSALKAMVPDLEGVRYYIGPTGERQAIRGFSPKQFMALWKQLGLEE